MRNVVILTLVGQIFLNISLLGYAPKEESGGGSWCRSSALSMWVPMLWKIIDVSIGG